MVEKLRPQPTAMDEMQFLDRGTSRHRGWAGFILRMFETTAGYHEHGRTAAHNIVTMQIGPPVAMTFTCEGPPDRRLQVPGDIDFMPIGSSSIWQNEGPTAFLCVGIDNALLHSAAEGIGLRPDKLALEPQLQIKDPRLEHIGWALKTELEIEDCYDRLYAEGLGLSFTIHLLRRHARVRQGLPARGLTRRQLRAVTDYIEEHLASDLSLYELATVAGVSLSHFKSLFKDSTGMPPHKFVIQRRVLWAAALLARGSQVLSELSLRAGFADQSHMARCMRRVLGVTPTALMRQYR